LEVVCTLAHAKLDDPKIRETELAKRVLLRDRLDLLPILAYGENDAAVPWNFAAGDDERSGRVLLLEVSHVRAHRTVDLREVRLVNQLDDEHGSISARDGTAVNLDLADVHEAAPAVPAPGREIGEPDLV